MSMKQYAAAVVNGGGTITSNKTIPYPTQQPASPMTDLIDNGVAKGYFNKVDVITNMGNQSSIRIEVDAAQIARMARAYEAASTYLNVDIATVADLDGLEQQIVEYSDDLDGKFLDGVKAALAIMQRESHLSDFVTENLP